MFQNKYFKFALHKFSRAVAIQLLSSADFPVYNGDGIKFIKRPYFSAGNDDYIFMPGNVAEPSKVMIVEFETNQARDIWVSKFKQTLAEMDKI